MGNEGLWGWFSALCWSKTVTPPGPFPRKALQASSPNLHTPELWSPEQGTLLQLRHCHHWLEKTCHTHSYMLVWHNTKYKKEAATIVRITCLDYNTPRICNMDVLVIFQHLASSPSEFFPRKKKKKKSLFQSPESPWMQICPILISFHSCLLCFSL